RPVPVQQPHAFLGRDGGLEPHRAGRAEGQRGGQLGEQPDVHRYGAAQAVDEVGQVPDVQVGGVDRGDLRVAQRDAHQQRRRDRVPDEEALVAQVHVAVEGVEEVRVVGGELVRRRGGVRRPGTGRNELYRVHARGARLVRQLEGQRGAGEAERGGVDRGAAG